jgi:predicted hydrolase (HD superfamily)
MELLNVNKINIKIHTDSSSGKSMATRISRDYVRLIEIHTNDSPADILTKHVSTETLQRHLQQAGLGIQHLNLH